MAGAMLMTIAPVAVGSLAIVSAALLRGWAGWLDVRRAELQESGSASRPAGSPELRELKDRVRKLEAIASGVDY